MAFVECTRRPIYFTDSTGNTNGFITTSNAQKIV